GELAAAYAAGVLSLEDAVAVVFHRSRCMELAPASGRMLAAGLSAEQALNEIAGMEDRVSLAAVNGPTSVTLSGDATALEQIAAGLEKRQIFNRFLHVRHAFHSPQLEAVKDELIASVQGVRPQRAQVPFISTVAPGRLEGPEMDADYWWRNFRQPVHFAEGVSH